MRRYTRTTLLLVILAMVLFCVSYILLIVAGVNPYLALVWNVLSSLNVGLGIIPSALISEPPVLTADLVDAFVFALLAVAVAALFFDFIKQLNITRRITLSRLRRIKEHVIIVPYNNFALSLSRELKAAGQKTVMITASESDAHRLYRQGELAVVADPNTIEAFNVSGIGRAKYVIACADNDIQNAMISITAKSANARARIVSRVINFESLSKIKSAGATRMIMPEITAGEEIGSEIVKRV